MYSLITLHADETYGAVWAKASDPSYCLLAARDLFGANDEQVQILATGIPVQFKHLSIQLVKGRNERP